MIGRYIGTTKRISFFEISSYGTSLQHQVMWRMVSLIEAKCGLSQLVADVVADVVERS